MGKLGKRSTRIDMVTLRELGEEYLRSAALLALRIEELRRAGADKRRMNELLEICRQTRETADLLLNYYDAPRPGTYIFAARKRSEK